jgi:uncharacterized membrane protein YozB (DUF420 family)
MKPRVAWALQAAGWCWIVLFVLIGVLGAGLHVLDHYSGVADNPTLAAILERHIYGREFFAHWLDFRNYPGWRMAHMVVGILFVLVVPLQFVPAVRAHRAVHRAIGRVAMVGSLILIASGMVFAFKYTYTGLPEQVPTVTYSLIYFWLVFMAVKKIRAGDVAAHREWMVRAFAMMMGISATRVWFYVFLKTTDVPSNHFFSSIFWLGLGVNLLIAEIWINLTRVQQATTAPARLPRRSQAAVTAGSVPEAAASPYGVAS